MILKNFKRIEQKYILTLEQKSRLLTLLEDEISPDEHGKNGGNYRLESCYYDTADLLFYQEKMDRKECRKKIRIRRYVDDNANFNDNSQVFVEIKERKWEITEKRRVAMTYADAKNFLEKWITPNYHKKDADIIAEITEITEQFELFPQTITQYDRQAFFGKNSQNGLRLTFDTAVEFKANETNLGKNSQTDWKIIENGVTILEMKAFGNFPEHILNFFESENITPARMSKYATSIEFSHKNNF